MLFKGPRLEALTNHLEEMMLTSSDGAGVGGEGQAERGRGSEDAYQPSEPTGMWHSQG